MRHQYIERKTGRVITESLYGDRAISFIYSDIREKMPFLFRVLTGKGASWVLGFLNFDSILASNLSGSHLKKLWLDYDECLEPASELNSLRKVFERKIRYWDCRPMPDDTATVVSPSDSRVLIGAFSKESLLFIKGKFFSYKDILGDGKGEWLSYFDGGYFAIFRLTPEKYHYNHTPVAGIVVDHYEVCGTYHSCNPSAVVELCTPYSKNRRVVTIIDTDVKGGSRVGLVAMVEVVALMIGRIVQCYSEEGYDDPRPVMPGIFLKKGCPKSLFRPGSSTVVLIFQKDRIIFSQDLIRNLHRPEVESRFSCGLGIKVVETDVSVRSAIGHASV